MRSQTRQLWYKSGFWFDTDWIWTGQDAYSEQKEQESLAVGEVSQIGRGKHTTRNVTLLPVARGLLADTPGFNQPALEGIQPEDLSAYFPEIEEKAEQWVSSNSRNLIDWKSSLLSVPFQANLNARCLSRKNASKATQIGISLSRVLYDLNVTPLQRLKAWSHLSLIQLSYW